MVPTYRRPAALLRNTLATFLAQTYPNKYMIILDDAGLIAAQEEKNWKVVSTSKRYPSFPAKDNALLALAYEKNADIVSLWDDDNVYCPRYLDLHVQALTETGRPWSTSWRWCDDLWLERRQLIAYDQKFSHSLSAFRAAFLKWMGGYREPPQRDFDWDFIEAATIMAQPALTAYFGPPQVVVRKWTAQHERAGMKLRNHPTIGYAQIGKIGVRERIVMLTPEYDPIAKEMLDWHDRLYGIHTDLAPGDEDVAAEEAKLLQVV